MHTPKKYWVLRRDMRTGQFISHGTYDTEQEARRNLPIAGFTPGLVREEFIWGLYDFRN